MTWKRAVGKGWPVLIKEIPLLGSGLGVPDGLLGVQKIACFEALILTTNQRFAAEHGLNKNKILMQKTNNAMNNI